MQVANEVNYCVPEPPAALEYRWPEAEYFVSQQWRLVYCPIPKVACSSLKLWWAELENGSASRFTSVNEYGQPSIDHGGLNEHFKLHHQLPKVGWTPLSDDGWFRFVIVRNPWSRLVSAFINKFVYPQEMAQIVTRQFHQRWKPRDWAGMGGVLRRVLFPGTFSESEPLRESIWPLIRGRKAWDDEFTFRHFVQQVATWDLDRDNVDHHWRPQYRFLGDVQFHFVGKLERLAEDFEIVAGLVGVPLVLPSANRTPYAQPGRSPSCFADWPLWQLRRLASMPDYRQFFTPRLIDRVAGLYRRDIEQFGYQFDS